jgi:hypothetical protein
MPVAFLAALLGCLQIGLSAAVPLTTGAALDRSRYMGIDQIKPGMTGIGRTVLKGAELTTFKVTVVDVLRNWGPKQDAILVRCAGAGLEHTGIIAGMSGSPVYLNDPGDGGKLKMIGAIAFGWHWNKDPVGGVQPIEQMLAVRGMSGKGTTRAAVVGDSGAGASTGGGRSDGRRPFDASAESRYALIGLTSPVPRAAWQARERDEPSGGLEPLMTPLSVGTWNPDVMAYLRQQLSGTNLWPVRGGGGIGSGISAPDRFEPGASLVIPFLVGDIDMSAVGTVTEVIGNRVLGFGHSMMAEGQIELPMATGWIHTPISLLPSSFKLGATGKLLGTLVRDEETGVWGYSDRPARMIPVSVKVHEPGQERVYHYQAMQHHLMTPWIIGTGLMASLLAHQNLPEEHTLKYRLGVTYERLGRFAVNNFSSMRGLSEVRSDLVEPMSMLMDNAFGRARVGEVQIDVSVEPKASTANIERGDMARSHFKPGESIDVAIRWRPYRAQPFVRHYTMKLPDNLPDGPYQLTVGGWQTQLMGLRTDKPHLFRTESMSDILGAAERIASVRTDRLYMRLEIHRGGLAMGKTELPELPSFRRQILDEAKLRAVQSYSEPLVVEQAVPFAVNGEQRFTIQVSRRADQ